MALIKEVKFESNCFKMFDENGNLLQQLRKDVVDGFECQMIGDTYSVTFFVCGLPTRSLTLTKEQMLYVSDTM